MEGKLSKYLDIIIESINYIVVSYALSNMAILLHRNPFYILLFASELWVTINYWKKMEQMTANKLWSVILVAVCFAAKTALIYFMGRAVGEIVPFR